MIFKNIFVYPKSPENLQKLYILACNLWSTWNYDAIGLFYRVDSQLFRDVNHNPFKFLHSLSKEKLKALSEDKGFLFELEKVWEKFQHYLKYTGTYRQAFMNECKFEKNDVVVYFSMEFGLHESIPMYAGGLGILSGDYLKGASDLGLPVIGIGLLYKYGYFTQHIDINGYQQEVFNKFENHTTPVREMLDAEGNWAYTSMKIINDDVKIKLWKVDVGKSKLILLDTDIEENPSYLRDITNELYASDREKRIQQELVLGIGGIKALKLLGVNVKIYHFNEGHSAFAVIGRLKELMQDKKFTFSEAKAIIRASTVFTTHTPVIAGNEHFDIELVKKYIEPKIQAIDIDFEDLAVSGYINGNKDVFWLPAFAIHFARYVNGVSQQHAAIAAKMWFSLFPERPMPEIPIVPITNGVHLSWISPPFADLFNRYLGPDYIHYRDGNQVWENIYNIPDAELWDEHRRNKKDLVSFIKRQFTSQMIARGYSHTTMLNINRALNTEYLTIVFARRFAFYKRPLLILKDRKRLKEILTNPAKPAQIIFAGKAHPADEQCKQMIKEITDFAREYHVEDRVMFLQNYDINIARHLYWGADVWLNTPSKDMEASGTSGMKAAMNGALHFSTLEGWWREGYNGNNGWVITAGNLYNKPELRETADANQLYDLLENEITQLYYSRNEADIPDVWVKMMKNSIFAVCSNFNVNRMLCDYLKKAYIPAKQESKKIAEDDYKLLKQAMNEEKIVLEHWKNVEIMSLSTNIEKKDHFIEGEIIDVQCGIRFSEVCPEFLRVELFYMYGKEQQHKIMPMELINIENDVMYFEYALEIEGYGVQCLNVRVIPANEIVRDIHPELIKWKD